MEYKHIDRKAASIAAALDRAPLYQKQGKVKARPAVEGEKVATVLKDGTVETVNTAKAGDWIVTNPSGEIYIIPQEKFIARYEPDPKSFQGSHEYVAKGFCRAIANPYKEPIEIDASWGSAQQAGAECMIADICDEDGNRAGEPYLIDGPAFAETYAPVQARAA